MEGAGGNTSEDEEGKDIAGNFEQSKGTSLGNVARANTRDCSELDGTQLADHEDDGGCAFAAGPPDLQDDFNIPCESSADNYLEDYCSLPVKAWMSLIEKNIPNPNKKITSKETVLANGQTSAFPNFGRCSAESSSSRRLVAGGVTPSDCSGDPSRSGKDSKDEALAKFKT